MCVHCYRSMLIPSTEQMNWSMPWRKWVFLFGLVKLYFYQRGVDRFSQTLATLVSSYEFSLIKAEHNSVLGESVRGRKNTCQVGERVIISLAKPEFYMYLARGFPHPCLSNFMLSESNSFNYNCHAWSHSLDLIILLVEFALWYTVRQCSLTFVFLSGGVQVSNRSTKI
jgi:hypothetical protein